MRCFISVELPENVRSQIFHSFEKLKNSHTCFGNFVKKENLHLTLKFLGNLSSEELEKVKNILKKIDFRQFPVETQGVGFFPNENYVKTIWLEMVSPDFEFLKDEIDNRLRNLRFNNKEKNFSAHLTIARIKGMINKEEFLKKVKEVSPKKMFFIADQFSLIKSILKRKGPEYKVLQSFPMRRRV